MNEERLSVRAGGLYNSLYKACIKLVCNRTSTTDERRYVC